MPSTCHSSAVWLRTGSARPTAGERQHRSHDAREATHGGQVRKRARLTGEGASHQALHALDLEAADSLLASRHRLEISVRASGSW